MQQIMQILDSRRGVLAGEETFDATAKNMDVALDSDGFVYVTDPVRLTITVFAAVESVKEEAI